MSLTTYRIDRQGADRLLFLFHGYSAEQHHLAAYVPLVDPDERFSAISPRALHDLPEGDGASWWTRGPEGPDPASFRTALDTITGFVSSEAAAAGVPLERCVLGGFSQGGFLALAAALQVGAPRLAGVWAMCCGLATLSGIDLAPEAGAGTPALIQYGLRDELITPDRPKAVAERLSAAGWRVTERGYDMAHSQTIEMLVDARAWLAALP